MSMMNTLGPAKGARRKRKIVGRGAGTGSGKTCGRGNKGQKSRSGAKIKATFEGGQMPLQMRLPKFGFKSRRGPYSAQVRLSELSKCESDTINLDVLIASGVVKKNAKKAKIFLSGNISEAYKIQGICVTKGARLAIEKMGGKIEE